MNNILNKIDEIQDYIYGTEINQGAYKDVSKKFEELRKRVKLFAIPVVVKEKRSGTPVICNICKMPAQDYPDIGRRTCPCGGLGYNVAK